MHLDIYSDFVSKISEQDFSNWDDFFFELINEYNKHIDTHLIQDILLRLMERIDELNDYSHIIDYLLSELGLFPYLSNDRLNLKNKLRKSVFLSTTKDKYTFHIRQAEIYNRIISGENIVLSAPTSFGKSLIIEAIIGASIFNNLMIVVPSIALMDELKQKFRNYKDTYKIITQLGQKTSEKNIYIFTQERVLDFEDEFDLDFFVIDEFYKLLPSENNDLGRCERLNSCFKKLLELTRHFYMCGPNIGGLIDGLEEILNCSFVEFPDYKTVATDEYYFPLKSEENKGQPAEQEKERMNHLDFILRNHVKNEQTIIFCKSPPAAYRILNALYNSGLFYNTKVNIELSNWLKENYHPEWLLSNSILKGLAFHHGKLPRSIASQLVQAFNDKRINVLVCTSTLIEGVNTNAKNIIIYDTKISSNDIDSFTFNNIAGRSGRMLKHFVGNVYIIGKKPPEILPNIDIPIITQSDNATDSMLLDVPEKKLTSDNKDKLSKYYTQKVLPVSLLRKHQGIDPDILLRLGNAIEKNCASWHPKMNWKTGRPSFKNIYHLSCILFDFFNLQNYGGGCYTPNQLTVKILNLIEYDTDKLLIESDYNYEYNKKEEKKREAVNKVIEKSKKYGYTQEKTQDEIRKRLNRFKPVSIDNVIQNMFDFKRSLAEFTLPRLILAINDVQKHVFKNYKYKTGDYSTFAYNLESYFNSPLLLTLEEFGIPYPIGKKVINNLKAYEDIDEVIMELETSSEQNYLYNNLTDYEGKVLSGVISKL
ncbi:DEAD/DEAH box helicase [Photobacterium damselae subsp. damselae]|uniref:DEAD/DEAH box helicase n=2 Tax=Photobacterium damselae TaxID=38293 RepID=UPI00083AA494|nr:DEAD/DEAH box helicase [Photobacterium damselae]QSH56387.1 DEAD/DEAH box helicase [Photobacterium damselae subsp. damselae]